MMDAIIARSDPEIGMDNVAEILLLRRNVKKLEQTLSAAIERIEKLEKFLTPNTTNPSKPTPEADWQLVPSRKLD